MPVKPPVFRSAYAPAPGDYERQRDKVPWRRWYKLQRWINLRLAQLRKSPLCAECMRAQPSRVTAADTVHHMLPHRGDYVLFHDPMNLESVCTRCHNSIIQSREATGGGSKSLERKLS